MDDLNNSAGNSMYMTAMNENNEHFAREIANQILDDFLSLQEKREIDSKDQPACDVIENISDPKYVESSVNDVDIERGKIHNSSGSEVSDRPLSYCALISSEIHSFAELTRETSVKIDVKKASLISDGWLGIHSYYVYTIESKWKRELYTVTRRFRDLEWLNNILRDRYKGMSIPPLPEKSVLNNSNSKFLEARRLEIEMSLNIIGKHPVLKTCLPFKLFLQCPDEFFDREQQNLSDTSNTFQYNDIEDAIDQFISIVEAQLNHILIRKIQPFSKELSSIDRAINLLHSPTYLFYTSFASLVKSQNDLQEIFDSLHFPESDTFQKTTKEANLSLKIPNNESNALVLKIKEETLKIEGLKNAISDYKKTMQKYSEFELLINRKLGKQRHVTDPQKSEKYLKEIESVQCEIAKIEKELENVESNIKRESIWFLAEREEHLEGILEKFVQFQYEKSLIEHRIWQEKMTD